MRSRECGEAGVSTPAQSDDGIVLADPLVPGNAETAAYWMDERGLAGFRLHPMYYRTDDPAEGSILTRPGNEAMFAAIAERRGVVQVHAFPEHAGQLDQAASRCPAGSRRHTLWALVSSSATFP